MYEDNGAQLIKDLEAAGFTGIKMWEQPINLPFKSGKEFL